MVTALDDLVSANTRARLRLQSVINEHGPGAEANDISATLGQPGVLGRAAKLLRITTNGSAISISTAEVGHQKTTTRSRLTDVEPVVLVLRVGRLTYGERPSAAYYPAVAVGCRLYAQTPCDRPATRRIAVLVNGHATYAPEPFCDKHGPSIGDATGRSFNHVRSDELPAKAGAFELREVPL